MSYKYRKIPKGKNVFWVKLVEPLEHTSQCSIKVGDITWMLDTQEYRRYWDQGIAMIEDNFYCRNFNSRCFEIIQNEMVYEIY